MLLMKGEQIEFSTQKDLEAGTTCLRCMTPITLNTPVEPGDYELQILIKGSSTELTQTKRGLVVSLAPLSTTTPYSEPLSTDLLLKQLQENLSQFMGREPRSEDSLTYEILSDALNLLAKIQLKKENSE